MVVRKRDLVLILSLFLLFADTFFSSLLDLFFKPGMVRNASVIMGLLLFMSCYLTSRAFHRNIFIKICCIICVLFIVDGLLKYSNLDSNIKYISYFVIIAIGCSDDRWIELFLKTSLITGMIYVLTTIWLYYDKTSYHRFFADSLYVNKNYDFYSTFGTAGITNHYSLNGMMLANTIIILFSCLCITYFTKQKKQSKRFMIEFILCVFALVLCGKRAHLLFPIAAIILGYCFYNRSDKNKWFKYLLFLAVAIAFYEVAISFSSSFNAIFSRFQGLSDDGTVMSRYMLWDAAMGYFGRHKLIGIGWLGFRILDSYHLDAHNTYIQLLCETGLVGTFVFGIFLVGMYILSIRNLSIISTNRESIDARIQQQCVFSFVYQTFFLLYGITASSLTTLQTMGPYTIAVVIALLYSKKLKYIVAER